MPSTSMQDLLPGTEGDMTASHFSVLRVGILDLENELTDEIWSLQSERLVESVQISSAWDRATKNKPLMFKPHLIPPKWDPSLEKEQVKEPNPDKHLDGLERLMMS